MIKNLTGFVFLLLLFFTKSVYAIGVSPYIVDISVDKGVEGVKTVKLFNDSALTYNIKSYSHDIGFDKKGNKTHYPASGSNDSAAKYIEIIPNNFVLKKNETKEVKIVVRTPENWTGGKGAVVFFDAKPDVSKIDPVKGKKIKARLELNLSLGVLVLQQIKGTSEIKSRITKADVSVKKAGKKLDFLVNVLNEGNIHLKGKGFISIFDSEENFVGKTDFSQTIVFPGKEDTLKAVWEGDKLEKGSYSALITYEYADDKSVIINKVFNID